MEPRVRYILLGLFVLILGAVAVSATLWLAVGGRPVEFRTYVAYTGESVSGLNVDAPVKYLGVDVGRVRAIDIDPADPRQVRLLLDIAEGTPVKRDTVAVLRLQGLITGLYYVELTGGTPHTPLLTAEPGERWPVITMGPSLTAQVEEAIPELLVRLDAVSASLLALTEQAREILDTENRQALADTLAHLERLTGTLAARSEVIGEGVEGVAAAGRALPVLIEEVRTLTAAAGDSLAAVDRAADSVAAAASGAERQIDLFGQGPLRRADRLAEELLRLTASLQRVAEDLERNPQVLLYGRRRPAPGPGE